MTEQKTDDQNDSDRPMPGPGEDAADSDRPTPGPGPGTASEDNGTSEPASNESADPDFTYGEDETQDFVDRSKIDFDPEDGLYSGSAVDGDTDIPGPHEGGDATGDSEAMAAKAEEMAKQEGTEDKIGEGASGSAVGKGQDGSQDDISGG